MFAVFNSRAEMPIRLQKWFLFRAVMLFLPGSGTLTVIWGLWDTEFHKTLKPNSIFCRAIMENQACHTEAYTTTEFKNCDLQKICYACSIQKPFRCLAVSAGVSLIPHILISVLTSQRNVFKGTFWPTKTTGEYDYLLEIHGQGGEERVKKATQAKGSALHRI